MALGHLVTELITIINKNLAKVVFAEEIFKKHHKVDLLLHNNNKCLVISYLLTIFSAPKFDTSTWSTIDFKSLPIKCHNSQYIYLSIYKTLWTSNYLKPKWNIDYTKSKKLQSIFHNLDYSLHSQIKYCSVKFIYSEQATKVCKISTVDLTSIKSDKSTMDISQNKS